MEDESSPLTTAAALSTVLNNYTNSPLNSTSPLLPRAKPVTKTYGRARELSKTSTLIAAPILESSSPALPFEEEAGESQIIPETDQYDDLTLRTFDPLTFSQEQEREQEQVQTGRVVIVAPEGETETVPTSSSPTVRRHARVPSLKMDAILDVIEVVTETVIKRNVIVETDSDSSDDEGELNLGGLARFTETTAQMLARVDREAEEAEERAARGVDQLPSTVIKIDSVASSKPLSPLPLPTTSVSTPHHLNTLLSLPSSTLSSLPDSAAELSPRVELEETPVVVAPSKRHRLRIVDSEEEEEQAEEDGAEEKEEDDGSVTRKEMDRRLLRVADSGYSDAVEHPPRLIEDDEVDEEVEDQRSVEPVPQLTRQEKIAALAKKRAPPPVIVAPTTLTEMDDEEKEEFERQMDEIASVTVKMKGKGKEKEKKERGEKKEKTKKVRGMTKKGEDEMNKETAALQRGQVFNIEPRTKKALFIADVISKWKPVIPKSNHLTAISASTFASAPPSYPIPRHTIPNDVALLSSPISHDDDPIYSSAERGVVESNSIAVVSTRRTVVISSKAQGKRPQLQQQQQESDPIEASTPMRPITSTTLALKDDDDDEEDGKSLTEILAEADQKKAKRIAAEKLSEKKRKAIALALAEEGKNKRSQKSIVVTLDSDDDDSDLEIEGGPKARQQQQQKPVIPQHLQHRLATPTSTYSASEKRMRAVQKSISHDQSDATDSQLALAGHTFGANLHYPVVVVSSTPRQQQHPLSRSTATDSQSRLPEPQRKKKTEAKESLSHETMNSNLETNWRKQAVTARVNKDFEARRAKQEQIDRSTKAERDKATAAATNGGKQSFHEMMKEKTVRRQQDDEDGRSGDRDEDDDEDDEDWNEEGSERDHVERGSGEEEEEEEEEEDEEAVEHAEAMPVAHRRIGPRIAVVGEDDEEEEEEDEEEREEASDSVEKSSIAMSLAVPSKMMLPSFLQGADDGAGFSQFFGDDFSQAGDNNVEGFRRVNNEYSEEMDSTFIAPVLINSAERAKDAARLELQTVAFRAAALDTPKAFVAPRQYINKDGFMTQTRPTNLFADSPQDQDSPQQLQSPASALSRSRSDLRLDYSDSQQRLTQTQLHAQTPTQYRSKLQRNEAMTEIGETQVEVEEEEQDEDEEEEEEIAETQLATPSFPSAQPPTKQNAFEMMAAAGRRSISPPLAKVAKARQGKNAFIDAEANLSDEEAMGMMANSGDEDEAGEDMDAELESLVDNEEVAFDLGERQDKLARERAAQDEQADHEKGMKRVQNVIAGGERGGKRKSDGLVGFDDDEFDDDTYGTSSRIKRARLPANSSITDLAQHPAMASFAAGYPSLQNETPEEAQSAVWLQAPEEEENEYDDEDEEEEEEQPSFTRRENEDNDDASMSDTPSEDQITRKSKKKERRPIVVTTEQVNQELAERARNRELGLRDDLRNIPDVHIGNSSSPVAKVTIKTRRPREIIKPTTLNDYDDMDSQYTGYGADSQSTFKYVESSANDMGESQGNGSTVGRSAAVTSFAKATIRAKSTLGNQLVGGNHGKVDTVSRSKLKKKNGFAT